MKKLSEIINSVRSGGKPSYDELRYTVCALEALSTFDHLALQALAQAEMEHRKPVFTRSAVFQYEEHFNRNKRALKTDPKTYIGQHNDPDNPDFIERRKLSMKIALKVTGKKQMNPVHKKAMEYIHNTGGNPEIEWFDEDHEPCGPQLREQMKQAGLIYEKDEKILACPAG